MKEHSIKIVHNSERTSIEIDGHNIANVVTDIELGINARTRSPRLILALDPQFLELEMQGAVGLEYESIEALEALGWTRPKVEDT